MINVSADFFEFLSAEFDAFSKPPGRDSHCNVSLSKNATTRLGCELNRDHAIRVVVKTTKIIGTFHIRIAVVDLLINHYIY